MNHLILFLFILSIFALIFEMSIFLLPIKRKINARLSTKRILFASICVISVFFLTFVPHRIVRLDYREISYIEVRDGSTGDIHIIDELETITNIVQNLSSIKFQKTKSSLFRMGYGYNLYFYDSKGKIKKNLIINSHSVARYKGYFYKAINGTIDYNYISRRIKNSN